MISTVDHTPAGTDGPRRHNHETESRSEGYSAWFYFPWDRITQHSYLNRSFHAFPDNLSSGYCFQELKKLESQRGLQAQVYLYQRQDYNAFVNQVSDFPHPTITDTEMRLSLGKGSRPEHYLTWDNLTMYPWTKYSTFHTLWCSKT